MKQQLRCREAKRAGSFPCAEGTLHRAKPCFTSCFATRFMRRKARFIEKSTCLRKCFFLAGMAGFEPTNAGVKVPCLTAWRHPNDAVSEGDIPYIVAQFPRFVNPFQGKIFALGVGVDARSIENYTNSQGGRRRFLSTTEKRKNRGLQALSRCAIIRVTSE